MNPSRLPLRHVSHGLFKSLPVTRSRLSTPLQIRHSTSSSMPKVADSSVWTAMIPSFILRRNKGPKDGEKSKEWNPASFYIIIFILIGSQAIRMIALKNGYAAYTRTTDAKIELLREVIERTKKGEKVDVERLLGTGDEGKEREWDEVLREIEAEDSLWHRKPAQPEPTTETQKDQKSQENTAKDPVIPATATKDEQPSDGKRPARKMNFF
ncbi:hypothetical protein ASPWEDRAFT_100562 [Aspergillus wentii DTO 134E9]|uniref:Uncharacterized protein n=1 Tax=Aspergillus wentii DTO 134E9 TaxID=1073089 RepID=A0A1L9S3N6_ASPWE|nr:uncharacterized protein ASPWEDRAFT_100562 [Aspergillus wentii DTO 134E9]OJJ41777.1 hypothetical protein ASPWEDRAFT_100562 [Aspergillus wentii DTO 134E9]